MIELGVNVDHVATLRQARLAWGERAAKGSVYPDPVKAALVAQKAGAHSIVMHLREDRRHIQDYDLFLAKEALSIKLNLEMSIAESVMKTALRLIPPQVTLVPEKRQERTTEGGLDLFHKEKILKKCLARLQQKGIAISLFIDPDLRQIKKAKELGVEAVEFHTGDYANQTTAAGRSKELKRLKNAVIAANERNILAHAGHGLDYKNVLPVKAIAGLREFNIGYSIVSRALSVGFENAVVEMLKALKK